MSDETIEVTATPDWGDHTVVAPGALKKAAIKDIPVKFEGRVVGRAELSEDGEIINAELDAGELPTNLREAFLYGIADSISIGVGYTPAQPSFGAPVVRTKPRELSQEEKSDRWNQRTLPWGM